MHKKQVQIITLIAIIAGLVAVYRLYSSNEEKINAQIAQAAVTQIKEYDEIFALAAYSLAFKKWNNPDIAHTASAANVAALLIKDDHIVAYGLNNSQQRHQRIFHAEMDMTLNYLDKISKKQSGIADMENTIAYVTLEPCLMCFSTLRAMGTKRIVYGEASIYHGAKEIAVSFPDKIYRPDLDIAPTRYVSMLNNGYIHSKVFSATGIDKWLTSKSVQDIYQDAYCTLLHYKVQYPENAHVLKEATAFLQDIRGNTPVCH